MTATELFKSEAMADFANMFLAELKSLYPDDDIRFERVKDLNPRVADEPWADTPLIVLRTQFGGKEIEMTCNVPMNFEQFLLDGDLALTLAGFKNMYETATMTRRERRRG